MLRPIWAALLNATPSPATPSASASRPGIFLTPRQLDTPAPVSTPARASDHPRHVHGTGPSTGTSSGAASMGRARECEEEDDDFDEYATDGEHDDEERPAAGPVGASSGKLWGPHEYPEGMKGHALWDWTNIQAAQLWECPCPDRPSCIGADRMRPEALLLHRKEVNTTMQMNRRDTARQKLKLHYSCTTKSFSRSFVVGELNDCCAASCGVADGMSWATWSRARTDLKKDRPLHAGRCTAK